LEWKESRMNRTGITYADEWLEAICQILAEAGDLLGVAAEEQYSSADPGPEPYSTAGNSQMLLPGIAEPHRWEFGRKG